MPDDITFPIPPIIAAVVRVMSPDNVAVPLKFMREPLMVNTSAVLNPFNSTMAPDAMVVPVDVPKALELPICMLPALTVVNPL